ncbi:TPA: hypothetical protein ACPVYN_002432 [Vibrio parahaemolyticus]|uniref:hypothetical protein n=1 Tax=Vibrio parahaemolyticus TaxID=670 RepID=UPI0004005A87|nr:hypothetical protein [Vibrio parahaemolyticus]
MKSIVSYLCDCGYEATLVDDGQAINVKFCLDEKDIILTHLISELSHRPVTLPSFYLNDAEQFL